MITRILAVLTLLSFGVFAPSARSAAQGPANQSLQVSFQLESSLADAIDLCQVDPFEAKQAHEVARRIGAALDLKNPDIVYEPDVDAECVSLHGFTLTRPGDRPYERVFRFDGSRLFAEAASMGYGPFYIDLCYPLLPAEVIVAAGPQPDGQLGYCTWNGKSWDEPGRLVAEISFGTSWARLLAGGTVSIGSLLAGTLLSFLAGARLGRHRRWLWFRGAAWKGIAVVVLLQLCLAAAWFFPAYGLGFIHSLHLMTGFGKVGEILLVTGGALWMCLVAALSAVRIGRNTAETSPLPMPASPAEFLPPLQAKLLGIIVSAMGLVPIVLAATGSVPTVVPTALAIAAAIAMPIVAADLLGRVNEGEPLDPQSTRDLEAELHVLDLKADAIRVTERPPFDGPIPSPLLFAGTTLIIWSRLRTLPAREIAAALALRPPLMRTWFLPALTAAITVGRHAIDKTLDRTPWPVIGIGGAVALTLLIRQHFAVGRYLNALERTGRRPEAIRGSLLLDYIAVRLAAAATPTKQKTGIRMDGVEPGAVVSRRWFRRRRADPTAEWDHILGHARALAAELGYPEATIDSMLRDIVPRADALIPDLPPIPFSGNPDPDGSNGEDPS